MLVIDEAAAIPLPLVKKLMGNYLTLISSTINGKSISIPSTSRCTNNFQGYEGTGRSLSLKLIQQLRDQSRSMVQTADTDRGDITDPSTGKATKSAEKSGPGGRSLRELTLTEPIRYAQGDYVERWLNQLLCLNCTLPRLKANMQGCPHPNECQLLQVNRDTLFSFHPVSERFLDQMMALYVSSHYKNSPNDLQ